MHAATAYQESLHLRVYYGRHWARTSPRAESLGRTPRAITFAEMMVEVLEAPDSHAALNELLRRSEKAQGGPVDLYMDQRDDED